MIPTAAMLPTGNDANRAATPASAAQRPLDRKMLRNHDWQVSQSSAGAIKLMSRAIVRIAKPRIGEPARFSEPIRTR
ncbi:hypothetical protein OKW28_004886 [Paraburkholderia sp. 40]